MNLPFYRSCFRVTAVGNIVGAISALAAITIHLELFYGWVETGVLLRFYHYNFWLFVLAMGVGYWKMASDPLRNRVLALIGAVGKLAAAASWLYLFLIGQAKPLVLLAVVYDGFFGLVMVWFYWVTKENRGA